MPSGRMPRRQPFPEKGAPPMVTPEVEKRLLDAIGADVPLGVAARTAGISEATLMRWCQKGREVEAKIAEAEAAIEAARESGRAEEPMPYAPTPREKVYYDIYSKVAEARAKAVTRSVLTMQTIARGGSVTKKTVRKYRDPNTGALVEEVDETRSAPDQRAAAFLLERGAGRGMWGKDAMQVELTGADGGPVQVGSVDATDLAARVTANMLAAAAATAGQRALPVGADDDDAVDGEIVEEG